MNTAVLLHATGANELIAYVPERTFSKYPCTIDDVVMATSPAKHSRPLR